MRRSVSMLALLVAVAANPAAGQTIYPLNGAQILAGATFDLKIEFPGAHLAGYPKVTIDGENAAKVLGKPAQVIEREDGFDHTAYWIRGARLSQPGRHVVKASVGDAKASVTWEVYATPGGRIAKNVILLIGDGLSKGIVEGRYGGELAMDDMPDMALVSTSGTDSIVTDSANAMTAYTTGHKTCVNALGVYCARNKRSLDHPAVETIAELAKRKLGLAVGVVTDTEIEDATPAGLVAHTRLRADYDDIVRMYSRYVPRSSSAAARRIFCPRATRAASGPTRTTTWRSSARPGMRSRIPHRS